MDETIKDLLCEIMPYYWYGERYLTKRKSKIEFDFCDEDDMLRIEELYLTYLWRR